MNILLVEPGFPKPNKSRNHASFFPVGLLKIGAYHLAQGHHVVLHQGLQPAQSCPDEIKITSLFTYWSRYVHETARYYRQTYPDAKIEIGGIYPSLMPEHCKQELPFAEVCQGLYRGGVAEEYLPAYDLLPEDVDYQIVHTSRGCPRKCKYCAVWKIEPDVLFCRSIKEKILRRKLIFYDNNFLINPHVENILKELAEYRDGKGHRVWCECQSGLDRRVINEKPHLAGMLHKAHFHNPRIAWDGSYDEWRDVKIALKHLHEAGYPNYQLYVFMLYDYQVPYTEMRRKLDACRRWGVRVVDCRYRPLDGDTDGYNPNVKSQNAGEYYVHDLWTDGQVRTFRRAVRRQNIAISLRLPNNRYLDGCERGYVPT